MSRSTPKSKRSTSKATAKPTDHPTRWFATGTIAALLGLLLTWIFWWPLWQGGGLIGGDIYPYYFPQKVVLAEALKSGEIPFWNPFVGFGYPVIGESQTAALYPPNLFLYAFFSPNTAYNLSQLGHYVAAFIGMVLLARRLQLELTGSLFAALAFVYGWFPARICLEWAIIGGAWFVWILWGATAFLQTGKSRYLILTSLFLALDLIAGHYNLAFITLLALIPWPWLIKGLRPKTTHESEPVEPKQDSRHPHQQTALHSVIKKLEPHKRAIALGLALGLGFLIAGVQLLPTWELKKVSQRQAENDAFAPTYGHLPPMAISQLWMPWGWYANEKSMDELLGNRFLSVPNATNQAEAQLYLGLIPFLLAVTGLLIPWWRRSLSLHSPSLWLAVILISLLFATGWPTAFLSSLPGIGFFRGPSRYSLVAALGIAVVAGATLDYILKQLQLNKLTRGVLVALLLSITAADLWSASRQYQFQTGPYFGRQVFYASLLNDPPIKYLNESPLRKFFTETETNARLYAPGQNIPSLLNVSAIPVYLGLGPEIYESDDVRIDFKTEVPEERSDAVNRLLRFGVTHLLLEHAINEKEWPVEPLGSVMDPFLNRALARQEPFYFYKVIGSPARVSFMKTPETNSQSNEVPKNEIRSVKVTANSVTIDAVIHRPDTLILRDLKYPGWTVTKLSAPTKTPNDITSADATTPECDPLFRCVEVNTSTPPDHSQTITWTYNPASIRWGAFLSVLGLLLLEGLRRGWRRIETKTDKTESNN
ncbi:hypothetical protein [Planctomicrobium sp. SH527]|uniref:hypothetical protein n=1 Tax=Planctomicrobium sp. SH527 TaxID=3448123 RepID=UPI003F5BA8BC